MNRFTNLSYGNLDSTPLQQLPFEQLDALLGQSQAKADLFDTANELDFKYLTDNSADVAARKQIEAYREKIKQSLVETAKGGNVSDYLTGLSTATKNIGSLFKAGGLANTLQERFNSVQAGMKSLKDKRTKDDGYGKLNYLHDLEKFKNQYTTAALNYDPINRTAGQIGEAQITPFTDIKKGLLEQVKAIDPDMTEQDINTGAWIKRVKDKGVDPKRVQDIFDSYMSSPEVRQQMGVERWSLNKQIDRDAFVTGINKNRQSINKNIDDTTTKIGDLLASGKRDDIKAAQSFLNEQGFSVGKADGVTGKKTKAAFEKYKNELTKRKKEILKNPDDKQINSLLNDRLTADYDKYFKGFFGQEHSETMKANPFALVDYKIKAKAKAEEEQTRHEIINSQLSNNGEFVKPLGMNGDFGVSRLFDDDSAEFIFDESGDWIPSGTKDSRDDIPKDTENYLKKLSEGELNKKPYVKEVYEKYAGHIESLKSPKEITDFINKKAEEIHAHQEFTDFHIRLPVGKNRKETLKKRKDEAEYKVKKEFWDSPSYYLSDEVNAPKGEPLNYDDLLEKLEMTEEDIVKGLKWKGDIASSGKFVPSGAVYSVVHNGKRVELIASSSDIQKNQIQDAAYKASMVLHDPLATQSDNFTYTIGNQTRTMYAKKNVIRKSDLDLAEAYSKFAQAKDDPANYDALMNEGNRIIKNIDRENDPISKVVPSIYDAETNKLMDNSGLLYNSIVNDTQNKLKLYE